MSATPHLSNPNHQRQLTELLEKFQEILQIVAKPVENIEKSIVSETPSVLLSVTDVRKDNYHEKVMKALEEFDKMPSNQQEILAKKALRVYQYSKEQLSILERTDESPIDPKYKKFYASLENLPSVTQTSFLALAELMGIFLPSPKNHHVEFKFGVIVVPIVSARGGHDYEIDVPVQNQHINNKSQFVRFGSKNLGNSLTTETGFLRLADFWECLAYFVAAKKDESEILKTDLLP